MNSDFRVAIDFFSHHKARKLKRRLGNDGIVALLQLWAYAAKTRPDGELTDMSIEDIEIATDWSGEDGALVQTLTDIGFLDKKADGYALHDWHENNSWAAAAESRSDASRLSRMAKTYPNEYRILVKAGVKGISKSNYAMLTASNEPSTVALQIAKECSQQVNEPLTNIDGKATIDNERSTSQDDSLTAVNGSATVVNEFSTTVNAALSPAPAPSPYPNPVQREETSLTEESHVNEDNVRAHEESRQSGEDDGSASVPSAIWDEPGLEFQELREFYTQEIRSEGPLAGFQEYKQLKASRDRSGASLWPGLHRILDDLTARKQAGVWNPGYAIGLAKYLAQREWRTPPQLHALSKKPGIPTEHQKRQQERRDMARMALELREHERAECEAMQGEIRHE